MVRPIAILLGAAALFSLGVTCDAAVAADACAPIGMQGLRPPAARLELERAAATTIVVHLKRACALIAKIEKDHPAPRVVRPLNLAGARLDAQVLAPIYRAYPDLRGLTTGEALPPARKPKPGDRPLIGAACAGSTACRS